MITSLNTRFESEQQEHEKALQNKEEDVMKMLANTFKNDGESSTRHKYIGQLNMLNQAHGKGVMTFNDGSTVYSV